MENESIKGVVWYKKRKDVNQTGEQAKDPLYTESARSGETIGRIIAHPSYSTYSPKKYPLLFILPLSLV